MQILCRLLEICSVSTVLNFEVKYPQESFGKVTVTSVSHLLNCIGGNVSFLGVQIRKTPFFRCNGFFMFLLSLLNFINHGNSLDEVFTV